MLINTVILGMFGGQELIIILIIILLLFGGSKIPQLMRGLGRGVSEYNKAKDGLLDDIDNDGKSTEKAPQENENKKPENDSKS